MASRRVPRETPERGHQLRFGRNALLQRPLARVDQRPQLGGDFLRQRRPVRSGEGHRRFLPARRSRWPAAWPQSARTPSARAESRWPRRSGQGHGQQEGQRQRPGVGGAVQQAHAERPEGRQQIPGGLGHGGQGGGLGRGAAAAADHHHDQREDAEPEAQQHRGQRTPRRAGRTSMARTPSGHGHGGQVERGPQHPGAGADGDQHHAGGDGDELHESEHEPAVGGGEAHRGQHVGEPAEHGVGQERLHREAEGDQRAGPGPQQGPRGNAGGLAGGCVAVGVQRDGRKPRQAARARMPIDADARRGRAKGLGHRNDQHGRDGGASGHGHRVEGGHEGGAVREVHPDEGGHGHVADGQPGHPRHGAGQQHPGGRNAAEQQPRGQHHEGEQDGFFQPQLPGKPGRGGTGHRETQRGDRGDAAAAISGP